MVIINGAGIAGLTLANALHRQNIPFVVLEQAKELQAIGAGIALQNNGLAILDSLGLGGQPAARPLRQLGGGPANSFRVVDMASVGLRCQVVHRCDLQQRLLANLPKHTLNLNTAIAHHQVNADNISVTLTDGRILTGDYLINCAGIHSTLHAPAILRDSGQWCWRTVVSLTRPVTCFSEVWFGQQRLGIAPIDAHRAYLFHVIRLNPGQTPDDFPTSDREQWIGEQHTVLTDITALTLPNKAWLSHPIMDRQIHWGQGRLVAIGDAAHAMTPNLGQGAVLAMEDAMELANLIAVKHSDPAQGLARLRHKRVARMHWQSWFFGKVAHAHNPIAQALKSLAFRLLPMQKNLQMQVAWMNAFETRLKEIQP